MSKYIYYIVWVAHYLNIILFWIQEGGNGPPSSMDMEEAQVDIHFLVAWQLAYGHVILVNQLLPPRTLNLESLGHNRDNLWQSRRTETSGSGISRQLLWHDLDYGFALLGSCLFSELSGLFCETAYSDGCFLTASRF